MRERLRDQPSRFQTIAWAAARALGWSPFDPRLLGLSPLQMEWAILMSRPETKEELHDERCQERDKAAVMLLEWSRKHVTRRQ